MNHVQAFWRRQQKTSLSALRVYRGHISPCMQNIFNYKEVRQEGRVGLRGEEAAKAALQLDTRTGGNHFSGLTVGGRGRINEGEEEPPGT